MVRHFCSLLPDANELSFKDRTIARMMKHHWPGNVRELRNLVERAALLNELPNSQLGRSVATASTVAADIPIDVPYKVAKQRHIDQFERSYITQLLDRHGGNISAGARAAGVDRMTIYKLVQKFGLK